MTINIDWQMPIQLTSNGKLGAPDELCGAVEDKPGIYVFSRKHGEKLIPFYIGKTETMKQRLKGHIKNNVKLMKVIEGFGSDVSKIGQGTRFFQYAYFKARPNQTAKSCLAVVEKALIRKAMSEGTVLLNDHFTRRDTHTIVSGGVKKHRSILAKRTSVEANS